MECTFINFNDKSYPVRTCTWERNGVEIQADISSTEFGKLLLDNSYLECNEYAELLDEDIMYYIPNDVLLEPESSDNDILEYIIKNVDSDVLDIFNKTKG